MPQRLKVLNIFAFVIMIYVNYLSNTGLINNHTNASVSKLYQNLFTPAGYAFSIWGIIYLLIIGFLIFQFVQKPSHSNQKSISQQLGFWFVLSCMANSAWLFAWLYEQLLLAMFIMIALLYTLVQIYFKIESYTPNNKTTHQWLVRLPFTIYFGWISVALIANIAALLMQWQWEGFGLSQVFWTLFMIVIATGLNLYVSWKKNLPVFAIVGAWALIAIGVANKTTTPTVSFAAFTASAVLVLFIVFLSLGFKNKSRVLN